jgi:hypothetical protein
MLQSTSPSMREVSILFHVVKLHSNNGYTELSNLTMYMLSPHVKPLTMKQSISPVMRMVSTLLHDVKLISP